MPDPESLTQLVLHCAENAELVHHYDRLTGSDLAGVIQARGIKAMIDEATGYKIAEWKKFTRFVFETVWCRLPPECFTIVRGGLTWKP
jgi:hypothetical protein